MEVGHLIHFSSQKYPFVVETEPCLDLACPCWVMGLTLREVDLCGPPRDRLKFTLRVCLRTWTEDFPPPLFLELLFIVSARVWLIMQHSDDTGPTDGGEALGKVVDRGGERPLREQQAVFLDERQPLAVCDRTFVRPLLLTGAPITATSLYGFPCRMPKIRA